MKKILYGLFPILGLVSAQETLTINLPGNFPSIDKFGTSLIVNVEYDNGSTIIDEDVTIANKYYYPTIETRTVDGDYTLTVTQQPKGIECEFGNNSGTTSGTITSSPVTETLDCVHLRSNHCSRTTDDLEDVDGCQVYQWFATDPTTHEPYLCAGLSSGFQDPDPEGCSCAQNTQLSPIYTDGSDYAYFINQLTLDDLDKEEEIATVLFQYASGPDTLRFSTSARGTRDRPSGCPDYNCGPDTDRFNYVYSGIRLFEITPDSSVTANAEADYTTDSETTVISTCTDCMCGITGAIFENLKSDEGTCEVYKDAEDQWVVRAEYTADEEDGSVKCYGSCFSKDLDDMVYDVGTSVFAGGSGSTTSTTTLESMTTHDCYLTHILVGNYDGTGKTSGCTIYPDQSTNNWVLRSKTTGGGDVTAECKAVCVEFDNTPRLIIELPSNDLSTFSFNEADITVHVDYEASSGYVSYNENFSTSHGTSSSTTKTWISKGSYTLEITEHPEGLNCYFDDEDGLYSITESSDDDYDKFHWVTCDPVYYEFDNEQEMWKNNYKQTGTSGISVKSSSKDFTCDQCDCSTHFNASMTLCGFMKLRFADVDGNNEYAQAEIVIDHFDCNATITEPFDRTTLYVTTDGDSGDDAAVEAGAKCIDLSQISNLTDVQITEFDWVNVDGSTDPEGVKTDLVPSDHAICLLTGMKVQDVGSANEGAACKIETGNGMFQLNSRFKTGFSGDAQVACKAMCVEWPWYNGIGFAVTHTSNTQSIGTDGQSGIASTKDLVSTSVNTAAFVSEAWTHDADKPGEFSACEITLDENNNEWDIKKTAGHDTSCSNSDSCNAKTNCNSYGFGWFPEN